MWYPLGKPSGPGVFHLLKGAYGGLRPACRRAPPGRCCALRASRRGQRALA